jgi:hypothetical protein
MDRLIGIEHRLCDNLCVWVGGWMGVCAEQFTGNLGHVIGLGAFNKRRHGNQHRLAFQSSP